jgi:exopolyphosphatase/guanosine-5'-triphosphate,3'-diphosphate pyrophosphatase
VENLTKLLPRKVFSAGASAPKRGRMIQPVPSADAKPVAVIDVGSNTVRLVVYDRLSRNPLTIFNEKVTCGLGREIASTTRLADDAIAEALAAMKRFRAVCTGWGITDANVIATAAVREAENGASFIRRVEAVWQGSVRVLSGDEEARLAAEGVICGFREPDGIVGDLGGGSLELIDVFGARSKDGTTLPLGGLTLSDAARGSVDRAKSIVRETLEDNPTLLGLKGRSFFAAGGTWRALATLHMHQTNYPLKILHAYNVPADAMAEFADRVQRADPDSLPAIDAVASGRRPYLPFAALVLREIIKIGKPSEVVISELGIREGLLYEKLSPEEKARDPLVIMAEALNEANSRSPAYAAELIEWMDRFAASSGLDETEDERRLRRVGCLLADIGWRAHPDHGGEQAAMLIANSGFIGVNHAERAFLALSVFYRYAGLKDEPPLGLEKLLPKRQVERARTWGVAMRVAYLISASAPGVLARSPVKVEGDDLVLRLPRDLAALASPRLKTRLKQLGKQVGYKHDVVISGS